MKNFLSIGLGVGLLLALSQPAAAQFAPGQRVVYRDGKISMSFEQFPVEAALNVIQARTGMQIVLPPGSKNQLLSLQLDQLPIEPAVRLLVYSIGFRGFALLYDDQGKPYRAVVIDTRSEANDSLPVKNSDLPQQPLSADERDRLQKQIELWGDLKSEARGKIEDRLKTLPPSAERDDLLREYGRQILGIKK